MKGQSFQEWISRRFKRTIFAVFIISFGILFTATTYFGFLDRINSVLDSNRAFASGQILNLQVYDFTRLNFDIESFAKGKPFEFVRVQDANGITIGKWGESGRDLESNGAILSPFKWLLHSSHTTMGLSQGFNRIIVKTDIFDSKGDLIGTLEVFLKLFTFLNSFLILGGFFLVLVSIIYHVLRLFLSQIARVASEPIAEIAQILALAGTTHELEKINVQSDIFEVRLLVERFRELSKRLSEKEVEQLKTERLATIGSVSAQVAHDIRSPLAALEIMIADSPQLPQILMIRSAVGRIRDISNQLSAKNLEINKPRGGSSSEETTRTAQLLPNLIESLITEKRIQYRSRLKVKIEAEIGASGYGLFTNIPSADFKCVLSNLIDNAVDALSDQGLVHLTFQARKENIELRIQDEGKGIPAEVLHTLMQQGVTYEKEGGSGLGLFLARTSLESWGGTLQLESQQGIGTTAILTIPKCDPPLWFFEELMLSRNSSVVILDDDDSIHQIWKRRFESLNLDQNGIQLLHFSTPDAIKCWYLNKSDTHVRVTYLLDYELLGQSQTGLDVIEELQLQKNSILVTSHFEEVRILDRCTKLGIKLLPKGMVGFVPVVVRDAEICFDAILIDDDDLMRSVWGNSAKKMGIQLKAFSKSEDFFRIAKALDRKTSIYVDAHLAEGVRGEKVSQDIAEMGFTSVYLASSYDSEYFPPMPWLSGIRDKQPPWQNIQSIKTGLNRAEATSE